METDGGALDDGYWPDSSPPYGGHDSRRNRERRGKRRDSPPLTLTKKPLQHANRLVGTWRLCQDVGDETALFNDFRDRLYPYLAQRRIVPLEATKAKRALKQARSLRIRRFLRRGVVFRWHSDAGETFWLWIRETDSLTLHLDRLQYQFGCSQEQRNQRLVARLHASAA